MSSKHKNFANNENQHLSLTKKIEAQQQKLLINEQRITVLEQQKQALLQQAHQKEVRIAYLKQQIKKYHGLDNPVVRQLREHFKALRQQLGQMMYQQEGDDVDIDNMTYEELLQLEQKIGNVSKGLSHQKFEQLDRFQYQNDMGIQECTICRDQFEESQPCIRLGCKHFFHQDCLRTWCTQQKICPNCKGEITL